MDVEPSSQLRLQFPDRLWYYDNETAPESTESTWWAVTNENGTSPAFWVSVEPFDLTDTSSTDTSQSGPLGSREHMLEQRLPSVILFYQNNKCTGNQIYSCSYPRTGTCCSNPSGFNARGVYIPSYLPGDILVPYVPRGCPGRSPTPITLGFAGCYRNGRSGGYINSMKTYSCLSGCRN